MNEKSISSRELAFLALQQVEQEGAYANLALKKLLDQARPSQQEAKLATEIVYGAARLRFALEHLLSNLLTRPLDQLQKDVRIILELSLYQLHYLSLEPYAVVNEGVKLAKKHCNPALAKLTNGVLRNYLRKVEAQGKAALLPGEDDLRAYLRISQSYPAWLVDYLLAHFGPEQAKQFCLAGNGRPGVWLRCNSLRSSREALLERLTAAGSQAKAAGFAPETIRVTANAAPATECIREGLCLAQGPASQLVAHALSPRPGSRVLDLAAAPGGKTTHLAAMMENSGELRAFDLHEHKIPLIRDNCRRLGIHIVRAEAADSSLLPGEYREWADYVLLDAPCSGLGVLNARPDSRYHKQAQDIPELAKLSYKLLEAAGSYLKPGGLLCYSTCTITEEENSGNLRRFLEKHKEFQLAPMEGLLNMLPRPEDQQAARKGALQLLPQEQGVEGFFISLLRKRPD
ncbi:MAG: 16S rRNA (cytosine(967)-C(5))-methyltransferase RsmB [Firmicutes bacterium]|nr:16S rRNA (cytosine(967)-C(5))-methyltransferase RsmB [Bacillota bacterium]